MTTDSHQLILIPLALLFTACSEPPSKPVPPLDPSKATNRETSEKTKKLSSPKQGKLNRIPLSDLYQLVQSNAAIIYDVRPAHIYKLGHIPSSTNWPQKKFLEDLEKHEPKIISANKENTPVVIYCTDISCPDAINIASRLVKRGHTISLFQGGYEAWKSAVN